jgi:molybdopterin molybdotransferase
VGQFDHVKGVMDELGMRTLFHGVAQRPGRPLKFGIMAARPVFGLPGNPVSTMVCFYLYARPALKKMGGHLQLGLPRINVICGADIKLANNLTEFVRVRLERKGTDLYATPTGNQGSGILSSLSRADALLIGTAKEILFKAGSSATALLLNAHAATDEAAFFEAR